MAASSSKHRIPQLPLDPWSTKEKLALASSVFRSGDQNWASVIRAIKQFSEDDHPSEWFGQKQCAQQYASLLDKIETPKRKRGERSEVDTPGLRIVRRLTIERIDELKQIVHTQHLEYKKMKQEIEDIRNGEMDDQLSELLAEIEAEEQEMISVDSPGANLSQASTSDTPTLSFIDSQGSLDDTSALDQSQPSSVHDDSLNIEKTEDQTTGTKPTKSPLKLYIPPPSTSPKSLSAQEHVAKIIQEEAEKIKLEQKSQALHKGLRTPEKSPLRNSNKSSPIILTTTEHKVSPLVISLAALGKNPEIVSQKPESETKHTPSPRQPDSTVRTPIKDVHVSPIKFSPAKPDEKTVTPPHAASTISQLLVSEEPDLDEVIIKHEDIEEITEVTIETTPQIDDSVTENLKQAAEILAEAEVEIETTIEETETSVVPVHIKEEPASPCSSVSSKLSEASSKHKGRSSKGGRSRNRSSQSKSLLIEEKPDIPSLEPPPTTTTPSTEQPEIDTTDDESTKTTDTIPVCVEGSDWTQTQDPTPVESKLLSVPGVLDSVPNSPASQCSDTEDERLYKGWKRSIMLVWRAAATHKYANVFLTKVSNDIAPGYEQIVHRPMDLREIKKNVESGAIRTTAEFQRDIMLMFTNAIMYNNSDHDVYSMATDMYNDVLRHIQQYISAQIMMPLRQSRRSETSDKEEDLKKRRVSTDQNDAVTAAKKRKTRSDD